jgi:hypothetical protein
MKSRNSRGALRAARILLAAAGVFLTSAGLHGLDTSLSGSYKTFLNWIYDPFYQGKSYGSASSGVRLNGRLYPSDWSSLEIAYILYPEIRAASLGESPAAFASADEEYRLADIRRRIVPFSDRDLENIGLYNEIDRAAATLTFSFMDLHLGRQAIAWGSARVINPTDVIVPFQFTATDTENRKGVDALRLRLPIAGMNEIDAGYIAGKNLRFDRSAVFGRAKLYFLQTDLSILAMLFKENLLAGFDLARAIGNAGAWLETAYVVPDIIDPSTDSWALDYLSLSLGLDYNLSSDLYGYLEYHYNSAGNNRPRKYLEAQTEPAYTEGNIYLLGRHYVSVGGSYNLGPLLPLTGLLMVNLNDFSAEISLSLEYNIKENVYISGGCNLGLGANPEVVGGGIVEYESEFGAYPNLIYSAVKIYF